MANEFLSQEEVDTLLKDVVDEPEAAALADQPGGIRPYKLGTQGRIVRGRMPTLENINDRFARLLRVGLFNFMRRSPDVTIAPMQVIRYGEFIRTLAVPTNLNLATIKPLRGTTLFVFEPALVFLVIDTLFGGDGRFHGRVDGREFTHTEQRIIGRLLTVAFDDYQKSWERVYPIKLESIRSEMHTQFASIAAPDETVVVSTFNVEFGGKGGAFHICIPYSTLEPIRDLIDRPMQCDPAEPDRRWSLMLKRQLQTADVEIVADLARATMKLKDLVAMKVGDVLPIELPPIIEAKVDGVPVLECGFGEVNGRYALRVERLVRTEKDMKQGDAHG